MGLVPRYQRATSPGIRRIEQAIRDAERRARQLTDELQQARMRAGLNQTAVARALGVSAAWVSRAERDQVAGLSLPLLGGWAATVGLALRVNLYPVGAAVRDAPQLRLLDRLRRRLHDSWSVMLEAGMPIPGDLRAIDMVIAIRGSVI